MLRFSPEPAETFAATRDLVLRRRISLLDPQTPLGPPERPTRP